MLTRCKNVRLVGTATQAEERPLPITAQLIQELLKTHNAAPAKTMSTGAAGSDSGDVATGCNKTMPVIW